MPGTLFCIQAHFAVIQAAADIMLSVVRALARSLRQGGKIALANWTSAGEVRSAQRMPLARNQVKLVEGVSKAFVTELWTAIVGGRDRNLRSLLTAAPGHLRVSGPRDFGNTTSNNGHARRPWLGNRPWIAG